jgi:hypothetical protein
MKTDKTNKRKGIYYQAAGQFEETYYFLSSISKRRCDVSRRRFKRVLDESRRAQ